MILGIGDQIEKIKSTNDRLLKLGVGSEILNQSELKYRWPHINLEGIEFGVYYPGGAGGSALLARKSCQIVAREFIKKGGVFKISKVIPGNSKSGKLTELTGNNKITYSASTYIFACGPWMPKIFPELFKDKLKVYRRDVLFVGTTAGDNAFSFPNFPIWSFVNEGDKRYYGMPDIKGRGFKVAPWPDFNTIDMDFDERMTNPMEIKRAHQFIERRFPALRNQPIIETRVCQLTFSPDDHFIIDKHPALDNVWLACAGSGHAFKHGPALGEYISNRIYSGQENKTMDDAFRLHK